LFLFSFQARVTCSHNTGSNYKVPLEIHRFLTSRSHKKINAIYTHEPVTVALTSDCTLIMRTTDRNSLHAAEMRSLRSVFGVTRREKINNEYIKRYM
jgi:hypothetical protein